MFQKIVLNFFLKPTNSRIITAEELIELSTNEELKLKLKKWISRILASKANSSIISGFMGCIKEVFHCIPIIFSRKRI
jgi:hypothetical protein